MAAANEFYCLVEHLAEKVHNFASDQLTVFLTNSAPALTNTVLADITEISYANCSSRNLTTSSSSQSLGVYKLVVDDLTLTASGGSVGPFRYIGFYNNTPISPADPLIQFYDYGSAVTIADGETFLIDCSAVNGILQLTL
jgi:hypothetical protein